MYNSLRQAEENETVRRLCSSYDGRALLWMIMEQTGLHNSVFSDSLAGMARLAGQQEIAQWLRNWVLTVAPECDIIMRREAEERTRRYNAEAQKEQD